MKRTIRLFIIIALALAVFGQYTAASAAEVIATKGLTAYTLFSESSACTYKAIVIQGMDKLYKNPPGPGEATSTVYVHIDQWDSCTGEALFVSGYAPLDEEAFVVDKKLGWTRLDATASIPGYKVVGTSVTPTNIEVDLDLAWTATGPLIPDKYNYTDHTPFCHWISRGKGQAREAEISGTFTYDGTTLTSDPSWYAQIFSFKAGELTVGCE